MRGRGSACDSPWVQFPKQSTVAGPPLDWLPASASCRATTVGSRTVRLAPGGAEEEDRTGGAEGGACACGSSGSIDSVASRTWQNTACGEDGRVCFCGARRVDLPPERDGRLQRRTCPGAVRARRPTNGGAGKKIDEKAGGVCATED